MSLINRVLQDLEARRGAIEGRPLPSEVRALPPQQRRRRWPLLPLAAVAIGAAAWAFWPGATAIVSTPAVAPTVLPTVLPLALPPPTPIPPAPPAQPAPVTEPALSPALPAPTAVVPVPAPAVPITGVEPTLRPAAQLTVAAPAAAPLISKEPRAASARDRAGAEYAKAIGLLNQGRIEPALAGLRASLQQDPSWAAPRQALIGTLLEQKRFDEAEGVLRQSLDTDAAPPEVAMQLARLQVERKDPGAAAATLQAAAAAASGNAEYQGLNAAVLQRLGRHREAAAAYLAALALAPQAGVWWMGLGLSLEADGRAAEAREAFRRARDSGSLSAELAVFVGEKLKGGN